MFCILLLGFGCQQQNHIRWVRIAIKSLCPALQLENSKASVLECALGALTQVGFVLVLGVQQPELRLGSALWLLELSLCLETWGKMNPSVPGNVFICCACVLKLTWHKDLPWRAAVECTMADRVAGTANSLVHTALSGHLHLLKPLSDSCFPPCLQTGIV